MIYNNKLYEELSKVKMGWIDGSSFNSKRDIMMFPVKISKLLTKYGIQQEGFIASTIYHLKSEIEIRPIDKRIKAIKIARVLELSNDVKLHLTEQYECPECHKNAYRNWTTMLEYGLGYLKHHKCNSCGYNEIVPELSKSVENVEYEVLRVDTDGQAIYK